MPYFFHGNPITTFILKIVGGKKKKISTSILAIEGRKGQWKKKLEKEINCYICICTKKLEKKRA